MLYLKGIIIGIGKILPGISGSLIAISMKLYEPMIESIATFNKNIKKNFLFLSPIAFGIITSIVFFSKFINFALKNYYFAILLLFVGLIIGSIEFKRIQRKDINIKKMLCFTLSFTVIIAINQINVKLPNNNISLFIAGIIEAISTIIPGISGTSLLMTLGFYNQVIEALANPIQNFATLIPFVIGIITGIILLTKIINNIIKNYNYLFASCINGFMSATLIQMYIITLSIKATLKEIIIGEILLIFGFIISKKMNKLY